MTARKHYKQVFAEAFIAFVSQLDEGVKEGKLSDKNHEKYIEYVHSIILKGCDSFSVEKFLLDTHQFHRNKSELYARAFVELQHHKTKVFLKSLVG